MSTKKKRKKENRAAFTLRLKIASQSAYLLQNKYLQKDIKAVP